MLWNLVNSELGNCVRATSRVQMFHLLYSRIKEIAHLLLEDQEAAVLLGILGQNIIKIICLKSCCLGKVSQGLACLAGFVVFLIFIVGTPHGSLVWSEGGIHPQNYLFCLWENIREEQSPNWELRNRKIPFFLFFCVQHTNWEYIHTGKQDGKYHTLTQPAAVLRCAWVPERERGWEGKTVAGKGGERKHMCVRTGLLTLLTQQLCTDVRREGVCIGRFIFVCPSAVG